MPKLNKTIFRSIIQDLKSLEKVCNELRKYVNHSETMSWRYPPQKCHNININSIISEYKGSAYECYLLVLELIYDRFQYFLHLIIKYLDMIPVIPQFDPPRNVVSPGYLSTGALLNMMWLRFQMLQKCIVELMVGKKSEREANNVQRVTLSLGAALSQSISTSSPNLHQPHLFNRNTQTETCSLIKCESCYISEEIMKFIVNQIQTQCPVFEIPSTLSDKREKMKDEMLHMTQWGAMMNWSNAVQNDLKEILQTLTTQQKHNEKLQESLEVREKKLDEIIFIKDKKILSLDENFVNAQAQLKIEKSRTSSLIQEKEEINFRIKTQKEEIEKLQEALKLSENYLAQESQRNVFLHTELKKIASEFGVNVSNEEYSNILETWKLLALANENEKTYFKNEIETLMIKLQENEHFFQNEIQEKEAIILDEKEKQNAMSFELQKMNEYITECQFLKQQNEQLQFSLNESEQRSMSFQTTTEVLKKDLEESKLKEKLLIENPDISTKIEVKVSGNPEQDMENQIQANEIRVQLLTQQTVKLKETLNKFRRLKYHQQNVSYGQP